MYVYIQTQIYRSTYLHMSICLFLSRSFLSIPWLR